MGNNNKFNYYFLSIASLNFHNYKIQCNTSINRNMPNRFLDVLYTSLKDNYMSLEHSNLNY